MSRARFLMDAYGVVAEIEGDRAAVEGLALHFDGFRVADAPSPRIRIELRDEAPSLALPPGTRADQIVDRGLVYNVGATTTVDHHGHATSVYDFARERGQVTSLDVDARVELGYLMLSSRLGLALEARGFVRIHGVGVSAHGRAAIVLAPSGGGKSTLARALLAHDDARLLGDDIVLVDRAGRAWPFPTPLGLTHPAQAEGLGRALPFARKLHAPKWILPHADVASRFETRPVPVALVVVLARVTGERARLDDTPRTGALGALFRDAIVGLGLPQVLELVARRGARDLLAQTPSALRRTYAVSVLGVRARTKLLEAGPPEQAAALLVRALEGA